MSNEIWARPLTCWHPDTRTLHVDCQPSQTCCYLQQRQHQLPTTYIHSNIFIYWMRQGVHMYVHYGRRGHLSNEWRHNENDVTMTIDSSWRHGDWRHMAMGCTVLVNTLSLSWSWYMHANGNTFITQSNCKVINCKLMCFGCTLDETLLLATFIAFFQFQTFTIMSCSVPTDSMYFRFGANACTQKNQIH